MLTLLSEARFWTMRDDIIIKDIDFGAFKYQDKKHFDPTNIYAEGKRDYAEKREMKYILENKPPERLRESLKKLEEYLKQYKIVYCQWRDNLVVQMFLENGLLIHISIDISTGDIVRITFDKYFIGKLVSDTITDALLTRFHILIAYNVNKITFVYLQKPPPANSMPEKISRMDPKIFNIIVNGPQNRLLSRQVSCNTTTNLVVVWTKSSQNEVYPWRPTIRDQDRANVHIYKMDRHKFEALCYYWTENDPINVEFSRTNPNQLHSVEQKVSRKGEVTVDVCMYQIKRSRLQRMATTSIPLQTQVCCHSFSPDNERLMLGCIDGSVLIFDECRGITHLVKASFIPTMVSWHCESTILTIANNRCQYQCFDISLASVRTQLLSDSVVQTNVFDLTEYFGHQPTLLDIWWGKNAEMAHYTEKTIQRDGFILLYFEGGPLVCMRYLCGGGVQGDLDESGFTGDVLIHRYIDLNCIERAINLLLCLNWDTQGLMCLHSLNMISNYIFTRELTTEREEQLQKALGSFHVPVKPLCPKTDTEFGRQVRNITRRFFFYMLRYGSYEKAFSLAIDINDSDLFMDLYHWAEMDGQKDLACDALAKAKEIQDRQIEEEDESDSCSDSVCSHSSCSECGESSSAPSEEETASKKSSEIAENSESNELKYTGEDVDEISCSSSCSSQPNDPLPTTSKMSTLTDRPPLPKLNDFSTERYWSKSYVPPLPNFTDAPSLKSVGQNVSINIPKPELKVSAYSKNQHRNIGKSRAKHHISYPSPNFTPDNILLVDPPLPLPPLVKSTSHSNIALGYPDFIPDITRTLLYHNSFSTESLNRLKIEDETDEPVAGRRQQAAVISLVNQQKHKVINVVPKPSTSAQTEWQIPDQTLGIPLTYNHVIQPRLSKNVTSTYTYGPTGYPYHTLSQVSNENPYSSISGATGGNGGSGTVGLAPVIHEYPLATGKIPSPACKPSTSEFIATKKSPITSSLSGSVGTSATSSILSQQSSAPRKEAGEKQKVKFSDTVTVAVVPENPRKDKPLIERIKSRTNPMITDPQKELADSLPLCSPNDEYLKDFTPVSVSTESPKTKDESKNDRTKPSQIKVVHFGVV